MYGSDGGVGYGVVVCVRGYGGYGGMGYVCGCGECVRM